MLNRNSQSDGCPIVCRDQNAQNWFCLRMQCHGNRAPSAKLAAKRYRRCIWNAFAGWFWPRWFWWLISLHAPKKLQWQLTIDAVRETTTNDQRTTVATHSKNSFLFVWLFSDFLLIQMELTVSAAIGVGCRMKPLARTRGETMTFYYVLMIMMLLQHFTWDFSRRFNHSRGDKIMFTLLNWRGERGSLWWRRGSKKDANNVIKLANMNK